MMQQQPKQVIDMTVAETMWRWVNEWPDKPPGISDIGLDSLDKQCPSMSLQPLSGTIVDRQFINGSFVGRWPFSIVIKTNVGADEDRIDSFAALGLFDTWLRSAALPALPNHNTAQRVEMTALPSMSGVDQDGSEYYEAPFALTYHHKEGP